MSSKPIVSEEQIDKEACSARQAASRGSTDDRVARAGRGGLGAASPQGDEIIQEGDDSSTTRRTASSSSSTGSVEVRVGSTDGTDGRLLAQLGPGDFFGEMALLDGHPRSASVFAIEEVLCLVLHRWDFHRASSAATRTSPCGSRDPGRAAARPGRGRR